MVLAIGGPFGLGAPELLIILAIVILIFGASRLGDVLGSLGKGVKEFKKNVREDEPEEITSSTTASGATAPAPEVMPQNGTETVPAIKCLNCGSLNPAGAKHCNQCGAEITAPVP